MTQRVYFVVDILIAMIAGPLESHRLVDLVDSASTGCFMDRLPALGCNRLPTGSLQLEGATTGPFSVTPHMLAS